ncbi:MAG: sigma 54-interacting transcriptional regulator [Acidobacteria bacterium]|nr:sigma 54-interacting transcriptional regulator [Acidobacteriota bacterium]
MPKVESRAVRLRDVNKALRMILEVTAAETGEGFFAALVKNLAAVLDTHGAWVTEFIGDTYRLRALAFWLDGEWVDDFEYDFRGTPCELVLRDVRLVHIADNIVSLFPEDAYLRRLGAVSYMGVPLVAHDGRILGNLAVLDDQPMPENEKSLTLFRIFAVRATAELQRLRYEQQLHEREATLTRLVNSAMDSIIELRSDLSVALVNPATEKAFTCRRQDLLKRNFAHFLSEPSCRKLQHLMETLASLPEGKQFLWIPGGLEAHCPSGRHFIAEATLSRLPVHDDANFMLVLRDMNERLAAEQRIQSLTSETEYLREELRELRNFDEIIGHSPTLLNAMKDVEQVAGTDTTVMLHGETGTGKELFARAIHAASQRKHKPLVKVNCAALPENLVESELFGHESGAFTGATRKREGRFSLANGGTIFLDEIGELPLDLQVKLLRVLQEGEFEPVGSSRTRRVNVRFIAATNRNLFQMIEMGEFRKDLYYRLNVFPIEIPPLRARGEDVILLANAFCQKYARELGRTFTPLSDTCRQRLMAYAWPGNVRELQNVIERAVITSPGPHLTLDRALPDNGAAPSRPPESSTDTAIRTEQEMKNLERQNILRALETTGWQISGEEGAARRLGLKPTTLQSRLKALGIRRPRTD